MRSVWPEMLFMRGPKGAERLRVWLPEARRIRAAALARRDRVLAHDWARRRLCHIFSYARPEQWNGYVPPARDEHGQLNKSPYRRALIELLADVEAADHQALPIATGETS